MSGTGTNPRKRRLEDGTEYPESIFNMISTVPETITDNETSESWQVGIENLPVEVLTDILARLNIKDRKNARAVCNLWYDACNQVDILRTEKLYFNGTDELSPILETLMNSKRRVLNLHFDVVEFSEYPESFWEKCGPRILSLDFSNCFFNDRTFEMLFRCCSKLEHLSWNWLWRKGKRSNLCSNHLLDCIIESEIVLDTLISLDVNVSCVPNYFKLLLVFPNIKRFGFSGIVYSDIPVGLNVTDLSQSELLAKDRFTVANMLNVITSRASVLEKIRLDLTCHNCRREHPPNGYTWGSSSIPDLIRLKEIDLRITCHLAPYRQALRFFFPKLKFLESVSLTFCDEFHRVHKHSDRDILLFLLEHCPKLRRLHYHQRGVNLEIDDTVLEKLASSRVKDLTLISREIICDPEILQRQTWPINSNLSRFHFGGHFACGRNLPAVFLKLFSNVKEVRFHRISDEGLQAIWNYKTGLKSLSLSGSTIRFPMVSGDEQNNENNLAVLENLECLEAEDSKFFLATWLASKFYTPRLKVLRMDVVGCSKYDLVFMLPNLAQRLPELEVLHVSFMHRVPWSGWITLCSNLKNLRFLLVRDKCASCCETYETADEMNYEHLFQICPTLRALVHRFGPSNQYYREVITNKVIKKGSHLKPKIFRVPALVPWAIV